MTLEATPTRGIEQFLSKSTFIDRTTKQRAVLQTVLEAQQRRLPADHISILSSKLSHEARERALSYGTVDAAVLATGKVAKVWKDEYYIIILVLACT